MEYNLKNYLNLYKPKKEVAVHYISASLLQLFTEDWKLIKDNKYVTELEHGASGLIIEDPLALDLLSSQFIAEESQKILAKQPNSVPPPSSPASSSSSSSSSVGRSRSGSVSR
jgi:hypothetical protein